MSQIPKPPLIIFITSVFDDPKTGPATFARLLYKYFKQDGVNFKIITSDCKNPDQHIITVKKTYIKSFVYYRLWEKAKKVIKQYPENHVIIHFNNAFPYLYFGKIGDKTITQVNDYYSAASGLYRKSLKGYISHCFRYFTESNSINKADIIIFNSNFTRNYLLNKYKLNSEKCIVIYKSIDESAVMERNSYIKTGNLLFIGNNYYLEGLDILVAAANQLPEINTIYVAGPSKLDEKLKSQITNLPTSIQIKIMGSLSQNVLFELMRKCDILVIPARGEALGVSIIESLAQGIPVITSGAGGLKEVLQGYPFICSDHNNLDPNTLAKNINLVLLNYKQYQNIFSAKRKDTLNRFSVQQMIAKLYLTYDI